MQTWAMTAAIGLAVLNLVASTAVVRAMTLDRVQRGWQLCFVWLAPVVGAVLILAFLMTDRSRSVGRSDVDTHTAGDDIILLDQGDSPCGCSEGNADSD